MNKLTFILIFLLGIGSMSHAGDPNTPPKVENTWLNLEQAVAEASKSKKKILVDVYTDWCGWCKKMDKETFADGKIAAYLKDKYVLVKMNAESSTKLKYQNKTQSQIEIARSFGVTGYPAFAFLEPNGELITMLPGYHPADRFMPVIKYIGEEHYLKTEWQKYLQEYDKKPAVRQ